MKKSKKVLYITIISLAIIMLAGGTYAFIVTEGNVSKSSTALATADNTDISFSDVKTYMYDNLYPVSEEQATNSVYVGSTNGICSDESNHRICSLYQFTVINNSTSSQKLSFTLNVIQNKLKNLKFKVFESFALNITSSTVIREYPTSLTQYSTDSLPLTGLTSILKKKDDLITYTVMFWIEQQGYDQTAVDAGKKFDANIEVNTLTTGDLSSGVLNGQDTDGCWVYSVNFLTAFTGLNDDGSIKPFCSNYVKDVDDSDGYSYSIIVPSIINGQRITTLGPKLFSAIESVNGSEINLNKFQNISDIYISDGITDIWHGDGRFGTFSFTGSKTGLKVTLPNSLNVIGGYSFSDSGLSEIIIPENVTNIGPYAFSYKYSETQSLEKVLFKGTIKNSNFVIGEGAFYNYDSVVTKKLTIVQLPSNLSYVGDYAFYNNNALTDLTIYASKSEISLGTNWIDDTVTEVHYSPITSSRRLSDMILRDCMGRCPSNPNLDKTSDYNYINENGLYQSNNTFDGKKTYYYRGATDNNYVSFAGFRWRIMRINEDGSIRMILDGKVDSGYYSINASHDNYTYMYYSNGTSAGNAYYELDTSETSWYKTNLMSYDAKIATTSYCEAARTKIDGNILPGSADMEVYRLYQPTFDCLTDGNGKGLLYSKIGLITYDEFIYAGGSFDRENDNFYLGNERFFWTMSPSGYDKDGKAASVWLILDAKLFDYSTQVSEQHSLRPVISLKADTMVTGFGNAFFPYVVQ